MSRDTAMSGVDHLLTGIDFMLDNEVEYMPSALSIDPSQSSARSSTTRRPSSRRGLNKTSSSEASSLSQDALALPPRISTVSGRASLLEVIDAVNEFDLNATCMLVGENVQDMRYDRLREELGEVEVRAAFECERNRQETIEAVAEGKSQYECLKVELAGAEARQAVHSQHAREVLTTVESRMAAQIDHMRAELTDTELCAADQRDRLQSELLETAAHEVAQQDLFVQEILEIKTEEASIFGAFRDQAHVELLDTQSEEVQCGRLHEECLDATARKVSQRDLALTKLAQSKAEQISVLESRCQGCELENAKLQQTMRRRAAQHEQARKDLEEKRVLSVVLEKELEKQKAEHDRLATENTQNRMLLHTSMDALRDELIDVGAELKASRGASTQMAEITSVLRSERDSAERELDAIRTANESAAGASFALHSDLDVTVRKLNIAAMSEAKSSEVSDELRSALARVEAELSDLRKKDTDTAEVVRTLKCEFDSAETKIAALHATRWQMTELSTKLQNELDSAQAEQASSDALHLDAAELSNALDVTSAKLTATNMLESETTQVLDALRSDLIGMETELSETWKPALAEAEVKRADTLNTLRCEFDVAEAQLVATRTSSAQVAEVSDAVRSNLDWTSQELTTARKSELETVEALGTLHHEFNSLEMEHAVSRAAGLSAGEVSHGLRCKLDKLETELADSQMSTSHLAEAWRKSVEKADEAFVETQLHVQQGNERGVLWLEEKKAWSEELSTVEEQCSALEKGHTEEVAALQLESQLAVGAAFRRCLVDADHKLKTVGKPSAPDDLEIVRLREELVEQRDLCTELHAVTDAAAAVRAIAGKKDAVIQDLRRQLVHSRGSTTNTTDANSGKLLQHLDVVLQALASRLVSVIKSEETHSTVGLSLGAPADVSLASPPPNIDTGNGWEGFAGKIRSKMDVLKQLSVERDSSLTRLANEAATKAVDGLSAPKAAMMRDGKNTVPCGMQDSLKDEAGTAAAYTSLVTPGVGSKATVPVRRACQSTRPSQPTSSTTNFAVPARPFVNQTLMNSNIIPSPPLTHPGSHSVTPPRHLSETPKKANLLDPGGVRRMGPGQFQTSHLRRSYSPQYNSACATPDTLSVSQRGIPPVCSILPSRR